MKKHLKRLALGLGCVVCAALAMTSCVDSNYDLANLNKDIQINVNDLVIPLNLDTIKLKQVMKIKDGDIIRRDTIIDRDGNKKVQYAVVKEGTFQSSAIKIKEMKAPAPTIAPIQDQIDLSKLFNLPPSVKAIMGSRTDAQSLPSSAEDTIAAYILSSKPTFFEAKATKIDKAVVGLDSIKVTTTFTIPLSISSLTTVLTPIRFTNFILQLPSGLEAKFYIYTSATQRQPIPASQYDIYSGELSLGDITLYAKDNEYLSQLEIEVTQLKGINEYWGCLAFDAEKHELVFSDSLRIVEGGIAIRMKDFKDFDPTIEPCVDPTQYVKYAQWAQHFQFLMGKLPQQVTYKSAPKIEEIKVNSFSGEIAYAFEGLNINPIELNNLPELLKKKGTDIYLENPQIYLGINNPLIQSGYNLYGCTGFSLEPMWSDGSSKTCALDEGHEIMMTQDTMTYVMAPKEPLYRLSPFNTPGYIPYKSLSAVLANDGRGLPNKIKINVVNPRVPSQAVTDFKIPNEFNKVSGRYTFYAPLQPGKISEDSLTQISYEDSVEINEDFMKDISIEKLSLDFEVDNELPLELDLYIYPKETINGKRQRMTNDEGEEIVFEVVDVIEALTKGQEIEAILSDAIPEGHVLTGIDFDAKLCAGDGTEVGLDELPALAPEMGIKMRNLKIKISGHYFKTLE